MMKLLLGNQLYFLLHCIVFISAWSRDWQSTNTAQDEIPAEVLKAIWGQITLHIMF